MTWREHCRPIIAKVLADNKGKSEKEIKKELQESYPFGERKHHPYKIWCDEIKRQKGIKPQTKDFIDINQTKLL